MTDVNATSENRFNVQFSNYKNISDSILSAQIPEISVPQTLVLYEGCQIKLAGDNREIGELTITFKLDENYSNYIELFEWINGNFVGDSSTMTYDSVEYFVLDAEYRPIFSFTFLNVFPISLEQIDHQTMTATADELEFTCTFGVNDISYNSSI